MEAFLAARAEAQAARLLEIRPLSGGAIQENWLLEADFDGGRLAGRHDLVLRTDAPSAVPVSLSRMQEFAVLRAAWQAGVSVPEPLWACDDPAVLPTPFFVMRRVNGVALAHKVVRDSSLGGDRQALAERLGGELARIHSIRPPHPDLDFLPLPEPDPARAAVVRYRRYLDALG
ncbi:MAG: phosphotransferase family protein, partial [Alphaproteobacteria bacterium]